MTKYDYNWCKPDAEMKPIYCPIPLRVAVHHHDEWDEPVLDPETGEPTGETEHKSRDWTEYKTVLRPNVEEAALAGYLPLSPDWPVDPPQGKHYERTGKIEADGEDGYRWTYRLVDDPPPPPRVFVTADLVEVLMAEGIYQQVHDWIVEQGLLDLVLATKEFDENNENFKAGRTALQQALGWTDEEVEELLEKCVKEGV